MRKERSLFLLLIFIAGCNGMQPQTPSTENRENELFELIDTMKAAMNLVAGEELVEYGENIQLAEAKITIKTSTSSASSTGLKLFVFSAGTTDKNVLSDKIEFSFVPRAIVKESAVYGSTTLDGVAFYGTDRFDAQLNAYKSLDLPAQSETTTDTDSTEIQVLSIGDLPTEDTNETAIEIAAIVRDMYAAARRAGKGDGAADTKSMNLTLGFQTVQTGTAGLKLIFGDGEFGGSGTVSTDETHTLSMSFK